MKLFEIIISLEIGLAGECKKWECVNTKLSCWSSLRKILSWRRIIWNLKFDARSSSNKFQIANWEPFNLSTKSQNYILKIQKVLKRPFSFKGFTRIELGSIKVCMTTFTLRMDISIKRTADIAVRLSRTATGNRFLYSVKLMRCIVLEYSRACEGQAKQFRQMQ